MTSGQRLEGCGRPCYVIVGSPSLSGPQLPELQSQEGLGCLIWKDLLHADAVEL